MNDLGAMAEREATDPLALATAFGISMPKLEIVERLAQGPATIAQLGAACGYTRHGVEPHLEALESIGLISCAVVRVEGAFRPTRRYTLDARRLEDVRWALHDVLDVTQHEMQKTA
jgi:predicted ArsR family transcriptional regulator